MPVTLKGDLQGDESSGMTNSSTSNEWLYTRGRELFQLITCKAINRPDECPFRCIGTSDDGFDGHGWIERTSAIECPRIYRTTLTPTRRFDRPFYTAFSWGDLGGSVSTDADTIESSTILPDPVAWMMDPTLPRIRHFQWRNLSPTYILLLESVSYPPSVWHSFILSKEGSKEGSKKVVILLQEKKTPTQKDTFVRLMSQGNYLLFVRSTSDDVTGAPAILFKIFKLLQSAADRKIFDARRPSHTCFQCAATSCLWPARAK